VVLRAYDRGDEFDRQHAGGSPRAGDVVTSKSNATWARQADLKLTTTRRHRTFFQDRRRHRAINNGQPLAERQAAHLPGLRSFGARTSPALRRHPGQQLVLSAGGAPPEENSSGRRARGDIIEFRDVDKTSSRPAASAAAVKSLNRVAAGAVDRFLAATNQIRARVWKGRSGRGAPVQRREQIDVFGYRSRAGPISATLYGRGRRRRSRTRPFALVARRTQVTTLYLQDKGGAAHLTFSFGVRWDRHEIIDAEGTSR